MLLKTHTSVPLWLAAQEWDDLGTPERRQVYLKKAISDALDEKLETQQQQQQQQQQRLLQ